MVAVGYTIMGEQAGARVESLDEHVGGRRWPPADVRHDMLIDALEISGRFRRRDSDLSGHLGGWDDTVSGYGQEEPPVLDFRRQRDPASRPAR